jgi:glucose-1-phosphate thymidylyltransferase
MQYLIDHDIKDKGEYQFTSALQGLTKKGAKLMTGQVREWLDCGNKNVTVQTNQRYLEFLKGTKLVSDEARVINSIVIQPSFVGAGAVIENSVVGPHVSVGEKTVIRDSRIRNSIIQKETTLSGVVLRDSMLGNFVTFEGSWQDLSLGDFNVIQ